MHQCFDCISILCSCEFLALCLTSGNYRDCKNILCKVSVDSPHLFCTLFCFFVCCMDCMSFLPQELSGTQERSGLLLPTYHGTPLIVYLRQVSVGTGCKIQRDVCSSDLVFRGTLGEGDQTFPAFQRVTVAGRTYRTCYRRRI